jgi:glycosyltransferase involved in cell wall biosynthesis
MKILFQLTHTVRDEAIFQIGHDFCVETDVWDAQQRPMPKNITFSETVNGHYGMMIAGTEKWLRQHEAIPVPAILKASHHPGKQVFSPDVIERVDSIVCPTNEALHESKSAKAILVEPAVNGGVFKDYRPDAEHGVLTVGNMIPHRPEKGFETLLKVNYQVPVHLVGAGNTSYTPWDGYTKSVEELAERYRNSKVYFNPNGMISTSVLEAMMTGMPVVTFEPVQNCDVMISGVNCIVVRDVDEAVSMLRMLLANKDLRVWMGTNARKTVYHRFHPAIFKEKWAEILKAVEGRRA